MPSAVTLLVAVGLMAVFGAGCSGSYPRPSADTSTTSGLVVAVRPSNPSFVVINADGTVRTYGPETHPLRGGVSGVAISPVGDVLVGINEHVYVVKDADFTREPIELSPSKVWPTPGTNEVYASATLDGSSVWIVQTLVPSSDGTYITVADLVRVDDGAVLTSTTIDRSLFPMGTTHADRLVLSDAEQIDSVALAVDGTIESLGSGIIAAVGARHVAILTNDHRDLVIHEYDGTSQFTSRITPPSRDGRWGLLGITMIPHVSIPWQTLGPDGQLLIAFRDVRPSPQYGRSLYLISKTRDRSYSSTVLATEFNVSEAAWTEDYKSIWLIQPNQIHLMRLGDTRIIESMHTLDDTHFVMAVG